jgi:hypothetical protein
MQKEDILRVLEHIYERQETIGIEHAFKFKIFLRKKKEVPAKYPLAGRNKKASKSKGKRTDKGDNINEEDGNMAQSNVNITANNTAAGDKKRSKGKGKEADNFINDNSIHGHEDDVIDEDDNIAQSNINVTAKGTAAVQKRKGTAAVLKRKLKGKGKETDNFINDNSFEQDEDIVLSDSNAEIAQSKTNGRKQNVTAAAGTAAAGNITHSPVAQESQLSDQLLKKVKRTIQRNKNPKKTVPKADALAIKEAKKFLRNSKRRK